MYIKSKKERKIKKRWFTQKNHPSNPHKRDQNSHTVELVLAAGYFSFLHCSNIENYIVILLSYNEDAVCHLFKQGVKRNTASGTFIISFHSTSTTHILQNKKLPSMNFLPFY